MDKIESIEDLKIIAKQHSESLKLLVKEDDPDGFVVVKVAMATCSIAAGASEIYGLISEHIEKRGINAIVTKSGCMSYCYAEPTIEVTLPGAKPVVFGNVDAVRADEIIEKYIKNGEEVDGMIPVNYLTVEEL